MRCDLIYEYVFFFLTHAEGVRQQGSQATPFVRLVGNARANMPT